MTFLRKGSYRPSIFATFFFVIIGVFFFGSLVWTVVLSFTGSKLLPSFEFVGFDQYIRLWYTPRWQIAVVNMIIFGSLYILISLLLGIFLAVLLDRKIRAESFFRTVFLYPYAVSLIVTGLAWRWLLEPTAGIQQIVRDLGWETFTFDWLGSHDMAVYALVIGATWHSIGFVMVIMLAGLRGVETELWRAIRVEGIPYWRGYCQVVLPSLSPMIGSCFILLASDVIRSYDLVVSLTRGGPGVSSDLPAKFAVDHFFSRANIGLASAASIVMFLIVIALISPYFYSELKRRSR
ncbi:carbohydrate ABC transporter permease [Mesorhizobium sp. 10J20-29]